MDVPFWIVAAITVGMSGAISAALGGLIERAGFRWGRWLTIVGIAAGLTLVRQPQFEGFFQNLTWTPERTESALQQREPEFYAYLKVAFPDDYNAFVMDSTAALRASPSAAAVEQRTAEFMQQLRRKYSPFIRFASDEDLAVLLDEQISFYDQLYRDDPATCAIVAINGPMALVNTGFSQRYAKSMTPQVLAMFRAARGGVDSPVARRPVADADWEELVSTMAGSGVPEMYLQTIASPDPENVNTCPAMLALMRAINGNDTEGARILRANFLADAAGG